MNLFVQSGRFVAKAMKWGFVVFCFLLILGIGYAWFFPVDVPAVFLDFCAEKFMPTNLVMQADGVRVVLKERQLAVAGLRLQNACYTNAFAGFLSAQKVFVDFRRHEMKIDQLRFPRLQDTYYEESLHDRDEPLELHFPCLNGFRLELRHPDILSLRPRKVVAWVSSTDTVLSVNDIEVFWFDASISDPVRGFCKIDIDRQVVRGEAAGYARAEDIRPMLVTLDVPVALPYMDAFTEVKDPVKTFCSWNVDLIHDDFDMQLDLHPRTCKYNGIEMKKVDGSIALHNYVRGNVLNYKTTVGPIEATDATGATLAGLVTITGTNGYCTVDVNAKSTMRIADVLKVAGFEGEYVDGAVTGDSVGKFQFRFPRGMGEDYSKLNGMGHFEIADGQLMRAHGFAGLVELLAEKVPGVSYLTDRTQGTFDYTIKDGILKANDIYVEGGLFSFKMYGQLDLASGALDSTTRVQFMKRDSFMGKILHPVTWPFTKLLLEFRLQGTTEKPAWKYVSVIDRVVEAVK